MFGKWPFREMAEMFPFMELALKAEGSIPRLLWRVCYYLQEQALSKD